MPLSIRYFIIFTVLLVTLLPESNAQRRRKPRIWEGFSVTGRAGANYFYGDLVDDGRTHVSLGATAEKELTTFLRIRASVMGGKMSGKQFAYTDGKQDPNRIYAYFDNNYTDFSVGAVFRPLDLTLGYFKQRSLNPYVLGQVGMVYYSASEYYGNGAAPEHLDGESWRDKSGISPVISGGLGMSYWINSRLSLNVEAIGNLPTTDEMDAHSQWTNGAGEIVKTDAYDFYYTTTVGLTFLIDDSRWKNDPKYNRKAYLKTRSEFRKSSRKNLKKISKRRRRRR